MTDKELRHLSRRDLLELLIEQTKEINSLKSTVQKLEEELDDKRIIAGETGSLAEAALKLNNVFADADKAVKQYLYNAKLNEEESRKILEDAKKQAEAMISEAEEIRLKKTEEA